MRRYNHSDTMPINFGPFSYDKGRGKVPQHVFVYVDIVVLICT
jgi:hypothetical protein